MHKVCLGCGKNKLHHGRGYCQQCYRIFMRNGKKLPLPQRQKSNEPQNDTYINDIVDEESRQQVEEPPINQFSSPVNLLVNRLNIKCLRCSHTIESEVACKYSLIYCGFCYFNKTGAKRPKPQPVSRVEQPIATTSLDVTNRLPQVQQRPTIQQNVISGENFIILSSASEDEGYL